MDDFVAKFTGVFAYMIFPSAARPMAVSKNILPAIILSGIANSNDKSFHFRPVFIVWVYIVEKPDTIESVSGVGFEIPIRNC